MSQSVTIKSNKYGINLILDADMSFADLIKAVVEKFRHPPIFLKTQSLRFHLREVIFQMKSSSR